MTAPCPAHNKHGSTARNNWRALLLSITAAILALTIGSAGAAQLPPLPEIPPAVGAVHPDGSDCPEAAKQRRL